MPGGSTASGDDIALPTLSSAQKERDYTPHREHDQSTADHHGLSENDRAEHESVSDTTATNSSDEFDWDEDEEGVKADQDTKAKRGRALYLAFMKLSRPFRVIVIGLLGAGVLITPLLVIQLKFSNTRIRSQVHMWSLWLTTVWAAGCITYLVVDAVPRLVIAIIVLFGGHVERLQTQLELVLAVSGWIKLALDVSWAWIALGVLRAFYKPDGNYWTIINRVMQALFSTALILLVEKTFLQFVAISFHRKALADRLAENRLGLKALDRLSNAQPAPAKKAPHSRRGHKHHTTPSSGFYGHKTTHEEQSTGRGSAPGSPVPGEKAGHLLRKRTGHAERKQKRKKAMATIIVDQVGSAIGQVALKDSKFNRQGEMGGLSSARRLARKLFASLSDVTPHRSHLIVDDFEPYFRSTSEAHDAFVLFDKDGNGDISKKEMRDAVQRIYRERKALIAGLKDVSSAVAKLDAVLLAVALVVIVFVFLLIFNRQNTLASLVPLATVVLGFSFIFGHTAQLLFESLIFIFSTHVFDVGDLVMIDDQPLLVREFGLFSTTFRRVDGQEIIAPNTLLNSTKLVHNLRRSSSMWETTNLTISYNTPLGIIEQLRSRLQQYINENGRDFVAFNLNIDKMEFQNAIWLVIAIQHRPNWQDWGGRWGRRTAFMRHLKTVLEDLDVKYIMPVQPIIMPNKPVFHSSPRFQPQPPRSGGGAESREMLGNAGSFQGSTQLNRAPSRGMRPGDSTF